MKVSNHNVFATPRYLSSWLGHYIEKNPTVYPVLSEISVGTGHFYSPVLVTLAQKEKSEVSTHPAEVTSEQCPSPSQQQAFNPISFFLFFFGCYKNPRRKCAESARSDKHRTRCTQKPPGKTIRKWGSFEEVPAPSQVFPKKVLAHTRVWLNTLPTARQILGTLS